MTSDRKGLFKMLMLRMTQSLNCSIGERTVELGLMPHFLLH